MPAPTIKLATILVPALLFAACADEDAIQRAEELGRQGEEAIAAMEAQYGAEDDQLKEAPDTDVYLKFGGYSDAAFDKVYRYQANVGDRATFIWMTFDSDDMDEQHIAVTLELNGINSEGEYTLDRQKNGNIYIEIDQLAFRSDTGNAVVNLTSTSGDYLEGTFSAFSVDRSQNRGDESIDIKEARFKLPLNDMRRNR